MHVVLLNPDFLLIQIYFRLLFLFLHQIFKEFLCVILIIDEEAPIFSPFLQFSAISPPFTTIFYKGLSKNASFYQHQPFPTWRIQFSTLVRLIAHGRYGLNSLYLFSIKCAGNYQLYVFIRQPQKDKCVIFLVVLLNKQRTKVT